MARAGTIGPNPAPVAVARGTTRIGIGCDGAFHARRALRRRASFGAPIHFRSRRVNFSARSRRALYSADMSDALRKVDHIGIAVSDLDAAIAAFTTLFGTPPESVEDVPDQKVRTAFFAAGATHVELLWPLAADSPISGFLAKRGSGLHHICFEVADIERALAEYRAAGMRLIDETPRIGAHGKRIAFLHPKSTAGILIEICEVARQTGCEPHPRTPHAQSDR